VAQLRCNFFSDVLGLSTSMTVILPQATREQIGMTGRGSATGAPVLYLLHGLSDDDTIWARRTSIERYAAAKGLAVVMPRVERSLYSDEVHGGAYWTFLSEELPAVVADLFRVSSAREDTFVAGLSMGGYGAFQWALRAPERFAAAASLSGLLDVATRQEAAVGHGDDRRDPLFRRVFGEASVRGSDSDLLALLERSDAAALPALYLACGDADELLSDNLAFLAAAEAAGVRVDATLDDGGHTWDYWDRHIERVLDWLPLRAVG